MMAALCAAVVSLALAAPVPAEPPSAVAKPRPQAQRVWTNDAVAQLPGTEAFQAAEAPAPVPAEPQPEAPAEEAAPAAVSYVKELDPEWYRARLAAVDAQLAALAAREARIRAFLAQPRDNADPGLVLDRSSLRLSPENELQQLAAERAQLAAARDDVLTQARRHWLLPGLLR